MKKFLITSIFCSLFVFSCGQDTPNVAQVDPPRNDNVVVPPQTVTDCACPTPVVCPEPITCPTPVCASCRIVDPVPVCTIDLCHKQIHIKSQCTSHHKHPHYEYVTISVNCQDLSNYIGDVVGACVTED